MLSFWPKDKVNVADLGSERSPIASRSTPGQHPDGTVLEALAARCQADQMSFNGTVLRHHCYRGAPSAVADKITGRC